MADLGRSAEPSQLERYSRASLPAWPDTVTTLGLASLATVALLLGRLSPESYTLVLTALAAPTDAVGRWVTDRLRGRQRER
jgi:hypothetical protein